MPQGIVRLDPRVSGVGPNAPLPLAKSMYDVQIRLGEMDEDDVQVHAVSLPPFLFCSTADDESFATGDRRGRATTSWRSYVRPRRTGCCGLGHVPLGWPGVADEARRVLDDLGLAGIAIGSRGGGKDLDDPVNDDLWALLSERDTFVFMHPSGMPDGPRLKDFWMPQLVGYPMETAIAVARLTFGRVLERIPFHLCLAHGGGCVPSLRGRMDMGWNRKDVAHTTAVPPSEFTDRLYYDTAVFNSTMLRRIVEDVGVEHVMLGTDHPFELGDFTPRQTVADGWARRRRQPGDPLGQRRQAARALGHRLPAHHPTIAPIIIPSPSGPGGAALPCADEVVDSLHFSPKAATLIRAVEDDPRGNGSRRRPGHARRSQGFRGGA